MSIPSILKLRLTVPSATSNGSEGAEGKSYILTLALSIEAEAEEMSCTQQIGLELLPSFWVGGVTDTETMTSEEPTSSDPTIQNMPAPDPNPGVS
jgi:hypothetical protein